MGAYVAIAYNDIRALYIVWRKWLLYFQSFFARWCGGGGGDGHVRAAARKDGFRLESMQLQPNQPPSDVK